ncbi:MAG: hypothetical protein HKN84_02580 [Gammaproteobacteria bacterium]|nr:hypothetical protein [Gammaproteobacteria bacterium]
MALGLLLICAPAFSHHNPNVHFDRNQEVEIYGTLTEVKWRSPHVQLIVVVEDENGEAVTWTLDEDSHIALTRRGVTSDQYPIGEPIRVAGFRGRRNPNSMFVTNTLLADGRELVAGQSHGPRWNTDLVMSEESYQQNLLARTSATPSGLFRVWSHDLTGDLEGGVVRGLWNDEYPLTTYARGVRDNWDEIEDNPFMYCQNSLPAIMDSPAPIEFVEDGGDVLLRHEELNVVRRFHIETEPTGSPNPFGISVGRWEDDSLVVTTTDIDFPWFDQDGIPQSENFRLVERFSVSDDDRYMLYSATATDSSVFTEPVVLEKRWLSVPGETLQEYSCSWESDHLSSAAATDR